MPPPTKKDKAVVTWGGLFPVLGCIVLAIGVGVGTALWVEHGQIKNQSHRATFRDKETCEMAAFVRSAEPFFPNSPAGKIARAKAATFLDDVDRNDQQCHEPPDNVMPTPTASAHPAHRSTATTSTVVVVPEPVRTVRVTAHPSASPTHPVGHHSPGGGKPTKEPSPPPVPKPSPCITALITEVCPLP